MQISYKRNLMTNYMIIEQPECLLDWEGEMLGHCQIKGMLIGEYVQENGECQLWYPISGKQALDTFLESQPLNYELLCILLLGIYEVTEQLESFLLKTENLLLRPECIFLGSGGKQIYFCYCPGAGNELTLSFQELMEWLLTYLDHTDEAVVELAYRLYEQTVKGGFCLSELQEIFHIEYKKEGEIVAEEQETEEKNKTETENLFSEHKCTGVRQKIMEILQRFRIKKDFGQWVEKKKQKEEPFLFEPEEEAGEKEGRPTVLLSELSREPAGILRYEGDRECFDLEIRKTPFVIGSDSACEGYIPGDTVSRMHARITKKEGIYFIEDLNSTNGTYVGGKLLDYKTKMNLERNEIVMFADEKFRFF